VSVLVFDGSLDNSSVCIAETLAIICSSAILVAEGLKSRHTDAFGLERVGLALDDKVLTIEILHGGVSDCFSDCNLGKRL
jgi:hypothetical protein